MLLETGEFVKEIATGEIHWIDRIDKEYIKLAKTVMIGRDYSKEYFAVARSDFYEKYEDVRG